MQSDQMVLSSSLSLIDCWQTSARNFLYFHAPSLGHNIRDNIIWRTRGGWSWSSSIGEHLHLVHYLSCRIAAESLRRRRRRAIVVCSLAKELRNFCPSAKWSFCLFAVSCQRDRYWFQEDEMNTRVVDSWVLLSLWPKSERFIGRQSIRLLLFGELCRLFFTSDF